MFVLTGMNAQAWEATHRLNLSADDMNQGSINVLVFYEYDRGFGVSPSGELFVDTVTPFGDRREVLIGKLHGGQQNRVFVTLNPAWRYSGNTFILRAKSGGMTNLRITAAWAVHGNYSGPGR
jgi:hypothetical protein